MNSLPEPTIRVRLDPLNPGHFLACCAVLELSDRAWSGAEGWFEDQADFFCVAPLEREGSRNYGGAALLQNLRDSALANARISEAQRKRLAELTASLKKSQPKTNQSGAGASNTNRAIAAEKRELETLWDEVKDGALYLGPPFDLRLDWHLDGQTGAGRFKTWAGQQNISDIAFELKEAIGRGLFDSELEWLFARMPCQASLHLDAVGAGTDLDTGFSFDPLKIRSADKRALVELLAFIGLQRFPPRPIDQEGGYMYATWLDPLTPQVAHAAARGYGAVAARTFEFRLLYRSKYLKSFLPAQPRRDQR